MNFGNQKIDSTKLCNSKQLKNKLFYVIFLYQNIMFRRVKLLKCVHLEGVYFLWIEYVSLPLRITVSLMGEKKSPFYHT